MGNFLVYHLVDLDDLLLVPVALLADLADLVASAEAAMVVEVN